MWKKPPKTLFFHTDSYALVHINNNQWSKHKSIPFMVRELGPICFQPNILFQFRHLDTRENMWLLVSCATIPSTGSWDGQVTKRDSLSLGITSLEPVFRNLLCQYWHDHLLKRAWSIHWKFTNRFNISNGLLLYQNTLVLFISYLFLVLQPLLLCYLFHQ